MLRTQKLSECRAEGSIEEPATEGMEVTEQVGRQIGHDYVNNTNCVSSVLLSLADSVLKCDTTQGLAYLLAVPKV